MSERFINRVEMAKIPEEKLENITCELCGGGHKTFQHEDVQSKKIVNGNKETDYRENLDQTNSK